jgi:hypothetical protein
MSEPQVVFGAGHVHITQVKDALGNAISPPQVVAAPAVQNVSADFGKADVKTMYGQKEFAIHAAQGKKSTEVSFECGEVYLKMLNALYFGQSVASGSHAIRRDSAGTLVPDNIYSSQIKIKTNKTFQLSKWLANTSVKIGTAGSMVAATVATEDVIPAGKYKVSGGIYTFSAADRAAGKKAELTHTLLADSSTTVVSTFTIPASLSFNTALFSSMQSVKKLVAGVITSGYFTRDTYAANNAAPAVAHYQMASNGVFIFNASETAAGVAIEHTTDGISVSSLIAALPTGGYNTIIDPPSSCVFVADAGVVLLTNTGTAMTGVAVGESLTVGSGTPTSGQYVVTASGLYSFAAADVGDTVRASYTTDFEFISMTPPNDGDFVADKGVRDANGLPLTRVALTTPISLLHNQYAVSAAGVYYFDSSNNGDRVYIDYEYTSTAGATLVIANNDMGSTPIVSLDISGQAEGQEWLIKYPRAIPKAFGFATKMDDYGTYKVTFDVFAERMSGEVGTVYMTA